MLVILKKDGVTLEQYNPDKVTNAISLANDRVENNNLTPSQIAEIERTVFNELSKYKEEYPVPVAKVHLVVIESIQALNEKVAETYKAYRGYKQIFNKTFSKIITETNNLLKNGDKENANKNSSLISTQKELTSGIISKQIALDYELPKEVADAHKRAEIHSHDLTDEIYGSINCCLFDMASLLKNGFKINGVDNTQPNHLETALNTISDVILTASSQQFGGFTVPELDITLAPYVRMGLEEYKEYFSSFRNVFKNKDDYNKYVEDHVYKILKHGVENAFDHRLNTINNSNGQTSFTTISFGLDTSKEGRMVSRAILESRIKGIGKNKITAIFPKLVFTHRQEINGLPNSPNYDLKQLAIECSMGNMYPDYLSLDSGYLGEIYDKYKKAIPPMGCRAFLSPWYKKGGMNPLDETDEPVFIGRANCGAVSLNLPRYALMSNHNLYTYYNLIKKFFDIAIEKHIYKYNKLKHKKASSNPLFFCEGGCHIQLKPNDTIEEAIKTFTWSIGYIGLDEVCRYFTGKGIHEDNSIAKTTLKYLNILIEEAKKKYGLLFALYSTPSESLCYRFLLADRKDFGIVEGVTDKEYYTNSFHVWVKEPIKALDKQDAEKPLFDLARGGRIIYNEFPHTHNKLAVQQCIDYAMKQGLYYGVNLQLDTCLSCGTKGEFVNHICTNCGSEDILSINRVCGYLGYSVVDNETRFNKGKLAETTERVDHFE